MDVPGTRYARVGEISIACQVVGDEPLDRVHIPSWITNVEEHRDEPGYIRFLRRLASFSRLILVDKRGTGLSDRVADVPTLEQRIEDVQAVMAAVGSEQAALHTSQESLARSLGSTRETVNRSLRRFERLGLVESIGHTVWIRDADALSIAEGVTLEGHATEPSGWAVRRRRRGRGRFRFQRRSGPPTSVRVSS